MMRCFFGAVIAVFGLLALPGCIKDGEIAAAVFSTITMIGGGGLMIYSGCRSLKRQKLIAGKALQMFRQEGKIDASAIAEQMKLHEIDVKRVLIKYQIKGLIPFTSDSMSRHRNGGEKKGTELQKWTTSFHQEIQILLKKNLPQNGLFVAPNISPKKVFNATRSCAIPATEPILGLLALSGNCKNCLLFADEKVYFNNGWGSKTSGRGTILYSEFPSRIFGNGGLGEVSLDNNQYLNVSGSGIPKKKVINILEGIKQIVVAPRIAEARKTNLKDDECPLCRSKNIGAFANVSGGTGGTLAGGAMFGIIGAMVGSALTSKHKSYYRCKSCGYKWKKEKK